MKLALFIFLIFSVKIFAQQSRYQILRESLNSFENNNSKPQGLSCNTRPSRETQCSNIISKLAEEGFLNSRAKSCREGFENSKVKGSGKIQLIENSEFLQKTFENARYGYLGDYSHQRIRSCLNASYASNKAELVSKFYNMTARLNQTASKIALERSTVDFLLEKESPPCPNSFYLKQAYEACQASRSCPPKKKFKQLAQDVEADEKKFIKVKEELSRMPTQCRQDVICVDTKKAQNTLLAGLIKKNPWFLSEKFNNPVKSARYKNERNKNFTQDNNVSARLRTYLEDASESLKNQHEKLEQASACVHMSREVKCNIDDVRETLSLTEEMPELTSVNNSADHSIDMYNNLNQCLEKASFDGNRTSAVIGDALKDAALGIVALPLGAALLTTKAAQTVGQASRIAIARLTALVGADTAVSIASGRAAFVNSYEDCFKKEKMNFKFTKLSAEQICSQSDYALSQTTQDESNCLINLAQSALALAAPVINTAQLLSQANKAHHARRAVDMSKPVQDVRVPTAARIIAGIEARTIKEAKHPSISNLPEGLKILDVEKLDGSKALFFRKQEKLKDGTLGTSSREFQIDENTGVLLAKMYSGGREFLDDMIARKAGKAHVAFLDVASLGYIDKNFNKGTEAGDLYAKVVAEKALKLGKGKITIARTGGDEFVLVIDETDPQKVQALLEGIQREVRGAFKGQDDNFFRAEKIKRAKEYKESLKKLEKENPGGLSDEQRAVLRKPIDELAKVQQPDVSLGSTAIGGNDDLSSVLKRAEDQAKEMKVKMAVFMARDPKKYESDLVPNSRPNTREFAEVRNPIPASMSDMASGTVTGSWGASAREIELIRQEELIRFKNIAVARYQNELGRSRVNFEEYIVDPISKKRIPIVSEIPTMGSTGVLDGTHSGGQKLILAHLASEPKVSAIMIKLRSLKYLNYFGDGTKVGDEALLAFAEVQRSVFRKNDLTFKLNGGDFLTTADSLSPAELSRKMRELNQRFVKHPKIVKIINDRVEELMRELNVAKSAGNSSLVNDLKNKINEVKNFDFKIEIQTLTQSELGVNPTLKGMEKQFDKKFDAPAK